MTEGWRAIVELFPAIKSEQTDLRDRQLNACLVAMARYLVESSRARGILPKDEEPLSAQPVATTKESD